MDCVQIKHMQGAYNVVIEAGGFATIAERTKPFAEKKPVAIITDTTVAELYLKQMLSQFEALEMNPIVVQVPAGEASKSLQTYQEVCAQLVEEGMQRHGLLIALGGGVIGDLTGFVAATLFRGLDFIMVPTTLLAQIDSSVGGKVALNIAAGKNLVGAFHHPQLVIIDPKLLETLNQREFSNGMAEVIKTAAIRDATLFDALEAAILMKRPWDLTDVIKRCVHIKGHIVALDEKEANLRMLLNFGHTIGHAIEAAYGFETFLHGEAVSIGMSVLTRVSERLAFTEAGAAGRIIAILKALSLPTDLPSERLEEVLHHILYDKKAMGESNQVVILEHIGQAKHMMLPYSMLVKEIERDINDII